MLEITFKDFYFKSCWNGNNMLNYNLYILVTFYTKNYFLISRPSFLQVPFLYLDQILTN